MAIQMRGGLKVNFDPLKMRPREWAVSIDPETENQIVWMCFRPGVVKRMGTYEDFKEQIREATDDIREEYEQTFDEIKVYMEELKSDTEEYRDTASQKATQASNYAIQASESASDAETSAANSENSANGAENFSKLSKSWARGETNMRPEENTNNSKYFSDLANVLVEQAQKLLEQAQKIVSAATAGALIPAGTVAFEDLPTYPSIGHMYNISNDFVTDGRFVEGPGVFYRAGANVYWTADGQWDVMIGTQVTGVKGNAERTYRVGNVNLTAANIGALSASGGIASGNIGIRKTGENGAFFTARNEDTGCQIDFGVASNGTTRGIYDENMNKWIVNVTDAKAEFGGTANGIKSIVLTNENINDLKPNDVTFYYAKGSNSVANNPFGTGCEFGLYVYPVAGSFKAQEAVSGLVKKIRYFNSNAWSTWKTIAFTDAMSGATASVAGKTGLVPAPAAGKQNAYLRGDGTWVTPSTTLAGTVPGIPLDQTMGKQIKDEIDILNGNLLWKQAGECTGGGAIDISRFKNKSREYMCLFAFGRFRVTINIPNFYLDSSGYYYYGGGSNGTDDLYAVCNFTDTSATFVGFSKAGQDLSGGVMIVYYR